MIKARYEVVIIGAGPAGMATAIELAQHGISVAVFDEQANPGGQIYRGIAASSSPTSNRLFNRSDAAGRNLIDKFLASDIQFFPQSFVWYVDGPNSIAVKYRNHAYETSASYLVIATGAQERPVAFKGWQLPGVFGAGAAQILLKTGALVPNEQPVLFGSGPLLYLLAVQTLQAGVSPRIILDTATKQQKTRSLWQAPKAFLTPKYLLQGVSFFNIIRAAGVPVVKAVSDVEVIGKERVERVNFIAGAKRSEIQSSQVFTHHGVIPETRLAQSLGCACHWDDGGQAWVPTIDEWGESTRSGVFIVGDNAGISGANSAPLSGRIAALQIASKLGSINPHWRDRVVKPIKRSLSRDKCIRPFLEARYRVAESMLAVPDEVMVCRCESVTAGQIVAAAREGCVGPNQLKAFTRCGMGACQGRMCGPTAEKLLADVHGLTRLEVGQFRARAPIRPVPLGLLASLSVGDDEDDKRRVD